ncbi:LysM peptidoglycan-binding domain-containing protein [Candidatus Clostridium radicumherbarum]|uniref:LysM peptidoglycan-binding domain-containing protein n=1 Tax=Candidatus Clostridium radicumherbarum TaxID=3381662 RepID=A0ABW8TP02_9CLOT
MKIHVVSGGDTVYSISKTYNVPVNSIINVNAINPNRNLVIGEALVIPGIKREYTVKPGDSLWSISRKFNVSVDSIADLNKIARPADITPGQVIMIPEFSKNYGYIETNGYVKPSTPEAETKTVSDVGSYLTYVSAFSYQVTENGSLTPMKDEAILNAARIYKIAPIMVITNIKDDAFDTVLVNTILNNEALQQTLINNVLKTLKDKGYYALTIDFEKISPENRQKYNAFLRKVVAALHPQGYLVGTALAPKTYDITEGSWHGAHDYKAHGEIVDFVVLMTYEWGWSGGPPLPVAPINEVRKVLDYAISVIPKKKILMGMPLYGYDWILPYVPGGGYAKAISPLAAVELAAKFGAQIKYDTKAQAPFFNYFNQGREHVVWFDDARSVQAKYRMVSELGLRGVSYWVLGLDFPQNWAVLEDMFKIVKVIK